MKRNFLRMSVVLVFLVLFMACTPPGAQNDAPVNPSIQFFLTTLNFIAVAFLVYHFIVLKPQTKEAEEHRKFIDGLSKNDDVVTSGGIIGKVVQKKSDFITIDIAQNVVIKVLPDEVHPLKKEDVTPSEKKK